MKRWIRENISVIIVFGVIFWSIDGSSYSTDYGDSNIEHEEIVKIIESME